MKPQSNKINLKSTVYLIAFIIISCFAQPANAQWSLTGNAGTNTSTNFIGTTDAKNLKIRTNNTIRMNITSNGKIAIGNFTPAFKLDVKGGSINTDSLYRIGGNAVLRASIYNTSVGVSSGESHTTGNGNTAVGSTALKLNTTGGNNTAVGGAALLNNNGHQNVAIGYLSLLSNTSGGNNTACGTNSMLYNIIGYANTALGHQSLIHNTEGSENTGTGIFSLFFNTIGIQNTASGTFASYSNTEGNYNIAIGTNALYTNQTESDLVAVGASALYNSTGASNVAVGSKALYNSTTGAENVAVGKESLYSNFGGSGNTTVGFQSLFSNNTGNSNTAIGRNALNANTSGSNNSAFGYAADVNSSTLSNATAIGSNARVACSNCLVLGSASVNVGIGLTSPGARLSISSVETELGGTVASNTFRTNGGNLGASSGDFISLANIGFKSTNNSSLGIRAYRHSAGSSWENAALVLSYDVDNTFNPGGTGTNYFAFSGNGGLGIGTTIPGFLFEVNGAAGKPGGGSWATSSDARLKKDIQPYNDGLASLLKINPVTYHYNEKSGYDTKPEYVGVLAQELKEVAPYMIGSSQKNGETYYTVDNSAMTYMLINAMKEQQEQIKELTSQIQKFENALSQCCTNLEGNNLSNKPYSHSISDKPILEQNQPNPFNKETVIKFYIPSKTGSAKIIVTDMTGQQLKLFEIKQTGYGEIIIHANELASGSYLYSLLIDGVKTESRRMELIK